MKKIIGICICLLLLVAATVAPTAAIAQETSANNAGVTIHFLNPTAIAVVNGNLFVADNVDIDNNVSAILCFTLSDTQATYRNTVEIDGNVTNLSSKGNEGLYAVLADRVIEYAVGSDATLTETKVHTEEGELKGFVDCVYGQSGTNQTEYFLAQQGLWRNDDGVWAEPKMSDYKSSVAIGENIYYLQIIGGKAVSKRYDGRAHGFRDDVYNKNNSDETTSQIAKLYTEQPIGLFAWGTNVGIFWNDKIHYVNVGELQCEFPMLINYANANGNEENIKIKDVEASDDRVYVLNDKNIVEVYEGEANNMSRVYSVGSDMVDQDVPHDYTSFTLVQAKGYPSNLVFKTNEETTIPELMTDAEEYIILGYEGDENSLYYYVLTNDNHFGWVQKANSKIEVINTAVSNDTNVDYRTKFTSLNGIYIHKLPRVSFPDRTFTQTASNMPVVTLLQQFTEKTDNGEIIWYYVSFEDNGETVTGFVRKDHVGEFYLGVNANATKIGDRKINSTLFEAVKVYETSDKALMDDNHLARTPDGNIIKLYSGQRVELIGESNGVAFIQIKYGDGTIAAGYVMSNRLIGIHGITTNAIVGLSVLAVAIALATALIVVFVKRRKGNSPKRKREPKTEE